MKNIFLTFDVDLTDYNSGGSSNELADAMPLISEFLLKENIVATWFIRIDKQIQTLFGNANFIYENNFHIWEPLINKGHQCAWHFHSYLKNGHKWIQNTDENSICNELINMYKHVKKNNWNTLRMGWAYHTNKTFKTIAELGITVDCSAFPRPVYTWEKSTRNWENSPQTAYYPSYDDYRKQGTKNFLTKMIPMHTVVIESKTDTTPNILRYINPVYFTPVFLKAIADCKQENIVLVSHPYEILPNKNSHSLMSFNFEIFKSNLLQLKNNFIFKTIENY